MIFSMQPFYLPLRIYTIFNAAEFDFLGEQTHGRKNSRFLSLKSKSL